MNTRLRKKNESWNWKRKAFFFLGFCVYSAGLLAQAKKPPPPAPIAVNRNRQLEYHADSLGDRVPDFSYCGYKAGEWALPFVEAVVKVNTVKGDATSKIQDAIDWVSQQPANEQGFRGTVLLQKGVYVLEGSLRLHTSGVVIRGAGAAEGGSLLLAAGKQRETVIRIEGNEDKFTGKPIAISESYLPLNSSQLNLASTEGLNVGDAVVIQRPSSAQWIASLGTEHFGGGITALGWKPGQRDLFWYRTITAIRGNQVSLDAPLTMALDARFGTATLSLKSWNHRVEQCGVEQLAIQSTYDTGNLKDENHRWMGITIQDARDCWVSAVSFKNLAGSAVAVYDRATRITVEDCVSREPISEIGGERRNSFFTEGQQVLFQRCWAEKGMHDFATGFCAAGPNAFVQCESSQPFSYSGGIDSWSAGVLFDVVLVDGNAISFKNLGQDRQGAGWNVANGVLWNCSAARIDCYKPPTAQNWAFGSWSQFSGDGYWGESNNSIEPRSLYYAQLKERVGATIQQRVTVMDIGTEASSSPSVEVAAALTKLAARPAQSLVEFIQLQWKEKINKEEKNLCEIGELVKHEKSSSSEVHSLKIVNGWLSLDGKTYVTGSRSSVPWWNGSSRRYALEKSSPALTRFVPGRTGKGLTDDLQILTTDMIAKGQVVMDQNYALWYERRRDDHERIRRMDGDVWAPFYELPFARSGKGQAWDGLSQYDLTKYNDWYWNRLSNYAALADQKGLVLFHQNYFQHNIIEAGAHYADFPWRTANNINNTGFPEPVPYAGDKRIFMDEFFYDTTHPVRSNLHRMYIRKCLDNFASNGTVIQFIGEEFTGPLHFVKFWLNTVDAWQKEKKKNALLALSVTKDVQDSILADPRLAALVDVIDIKYWYYQADGKTYAPLGGQHLAPRQHARLLKPKSSSPEQVYKSVREYRNRFPSKAVIYSADAYDKMSLPVFMAGGSLPSSLQLPAPLKQKVLEMQPLAGLQTAWCLVDKIQKNFLVSFPTKESRLDDKSLTGRFKVCKVDFKNGTLDCSSEVLELKGGLQEQQLSSGANLFWLEKISSE